MLSHIKRDENGYRQYCEGDLSWIAFLLRLRKTGMPMIQMKQFSDLRSQGNSTASSRRKLLEEHHSNMQKEIKELEGNLQEIQKKIAYYKELEKNNKRGWIIIQPLFVLLSPKRSSITPWIYSTV
ncbi:MerR family transcriptional regulator [Priestia endophytica]|uniref:MerR family transcriptional regulator n=1 Tax=Priestia endophytica TaxID=135735 RepID=UPI002E1F4094